MYSLVITEDSLFEIQQALQRLYDSSFDGLTQKWDCSTDEGREGFEFMADDCSEIAHFLGLALEEYKQDDNE